MKIKVYPRKSNQYGLAPILIIIFIAIIAGGSVLVFKNIPLKPSNQAPKIEESTSSTQLKADLSPIPSTPNNATTTPTKIPSPTPKSSAKAVIPSPSTTTQTRTIIIEGFAYEDRTNDGLFNSDDPKLPNMHFLVSDSGNTWSYSTYTGPDGYFMVSHVFAGNIVIKPACNENFCPKDGPKTFSSSSSNQQFAFRSTSAPTGSNNGVLEGDLIIETDRQYKFYVLDKNDNYYTNVEWSGGHFKIQSLPNNQTYIIRISYGDDSPGNNEITLTPSNPEQKTLQIHVK